MIRRITTCLFVFLLFFTTIQARESEEMTVLQFYNAWIKDKNAWKGKSVSIKGRINRVRINFIKNKPSKLIIFLPKSNDEVGGMELLFPFSPHLKKNIVTMADSKNIFSFNCIEAGEVDYVPTLTNCKVVTNKK